MSTQRNPARKISRKIALLAAFALMAAVTPALGSTTGGISSTGGTTTGTNTTATRCNHGTPNHPANEGRIINSSTNGVPDKVGDKAAIPPCDISGPAATAVNAMYAAANKIRRKPYIWGGGHARWWDKGYDCSGSVSYVLHGAGWLSRPFNSGRFARWGSAHRGHWVTIFANSGHVYAKIAGLRWDTSMNGSNGPGWSSRMRSHSGFKIRHRRGY